jgi:hypothetical protein
VHFLALGLTVSKRNSLSSLPLEHCSTSSPVHVKFGRPNNRWQVGPRSNTRVLLNLIRAGPRSPPERGPRRRKRVAARRRPRPTRQQRSRRKKKTGSPIERFKRDRWYAPRTCLTKEVLKWARPNLTYRFGSLLRSAASFSCFGS